MDDLKVAVNAIVISIPMDKRVPTELWQMIMQKLPTKSDTLSAMMVNKTLYAVGLPILYRAIKIGPRIDEIA